MIPMGTHLKLKKGNNKRIKIMWEMKIIKKIQMKIFKKTKREAA